MQCSWLTWDWDTNHWSALLASSVGFHRLILVHLFISIHLLSIVWLLISQYTSLSGSRHRDLLEAANITHCPPSPVSRVCLSSCKQCSARKPISFLFSDVRNTRSPVVFRKHHFFAIEPECTGNPVSTFTNVTSRWWEHVVMKRVADNRIHINFHSIQSIDGSIDLIFILWVLMSHHASLTYHHFSSGALFSSRTRMF